MLVIPAIDIKNGKCVRLQQGEFSRLTIYSAQPEVVALRFQSAGAVLLHVVDLDATAGLGSINVEVIERILAAVQIPVQLGGGIRTLEQIEFWFNRGVQRIVIGTAAVKNPQLVLEALKTYRPERLTLAVDARDGRVAIEGWQQETELPAVELARQFKSAGLNRVLYTDIARDGMLQGPAIESTKELAVATGLRVTASGGISSKADLDALQKLAPFGVDSVIVGRAFYEGRIQPEEVL